MASAEIRDERDTLGIQTLKKILKRFENETLAFI